MKKYDVIVIGGGLIGCTLAGEVRRQNLSVLVVERGVPGAESTSAAAGMLAPHAGPGLKSTFFKLLRESLSVYPQFVQEMEQESGIETEFRNSGLYYLSLNDEDEEKLEEKLSWQKKSDVEADWIPASEVRKKEPWLGPNVRRALYFPEDCQIDNVQLFKAVHAVAKKRGVEFLSGQAAVRLWLDGEKLRGVQVGSESIEGGMVVNCAGSWADFDSSLPFRIPVKPARGQMIVLHKSPVVLNRMLYTRRVYFVPRRDGRLIIGSTVESVGYDKNVTVKGIHKLIKGALEVNPEFRDFPIRETWAGLRPRSKDNLPILGKTPIERFFVATGHFRNGILLAPLTAKILAAIMLGKDSAYDVSRYQLSRFLGPKQKVSK